MPISLYPNWAACSTNSCGCDAPRRKEKLVVIWSSLYCISIFLFMHICTFIYLRVFFMQILHAATKLPFLPHHNVPCEITNNGNLLHPLLQSNLYVPRSVSTIPAQCVPVHLL